MQACVNAVCALALLAGCHVSSGPASAEGAPGAWQGISLKLREDCVDALLDGRSPDLLSFPLSMGRALPVSNPNGLGHSGLTRVAGGARRGTKGLSLVSRHLVWTRGYQWRGFLA